MSSDPDQDAERPQAEAPSASRRFAGKTVIVTGASDRGIGGAIAERLADEGAELSLLSRSEPRRLLKKLQRRSAAALWSQCDVTSAADVAAAIDACTSKHGKLDVLINNAGVEVAKPLQSFTDDQWQAMLDVNLHGAIRCTRAALPYLMQERGAIVNVSSALALGGCPGFSIYSASKAALNGFTQSLAWELAPNVRVVGVAPGLVHTPMIHKHIQHLTDEIWKQIEHCHPLGMGSPHQVAAAVAFLASDDASWITGVTLPLGWAPHYPLPTGQFLEG